MWVIYILKDKIVTIKSDNACSYKEAEAIYRKNILTESLGQRENLTTGEDNEGGSTLTSDTEMSAEMNKITAQETLSDNIANHHPFEKSEADKTILEIEIQSPLERELNSSQSSTPKRNVLPEGLGSPNQRDNYRKKVRQKSPN